MKNRKKQKKNNTDSSLSAERQAMEQIAKSEGLSIELVQKHIQFAMLLGLTNNYPPMQEAWRRIPSVGDMPTPEELIVYCAKKASEKIQK